MLGIILAVSRGLVQDSGHGAFLCLLHCCKGIAFGEINFKRKFACCRWAAVLGIILAVSRGLVQEPGVASDPELVLLEVVAHTHYLPRHWRSRAHTREVHSNFQALFPFKVALTTNANT